MAESIGRRPPLPALSYLDTDKIKREQMAYNSTAPMNAPPPLHSPSTTYSGPPPPYSYPSSAVSSSIGPRDHVTIPAPLPQTYTLSNEPRQYASEKDQAPSRQALPSIQEALKEDRGMSIGSLLSPTNGAPPPPPPRTQGPATAGQSPTSPVTRSTIDVPPPRPAEAYQPPTPVSYESYERSTRPMQSPSATQNSVNRSPPNISRPLEHPARTAPSPSMSAAQIPAQQSPEYRYRPAPRSPPAEPALPQKPYQPAYTYPPTNPPVAAYPPATTASQPAWRSAQAEAEHRAEIIRSTTRHSPRSHHPYGESVKRHLDIFDIETSLNEIAEGSGQALEFARLYGIHAHQTQRSGPIPGSLPTLSECDHIMRQQQRVLDSMGNIRDLIIRQQQALAEQRSFDQRAFKAGHSEPEEDPHAYMDKMEGGGGFAGPDAKKRRGRAAPPGRCHSCNRAETPEWRRGPDGARTLCNACGLHYAKLQRKMDSKDNGNGPSKLRPKDSAGSSP